MPQPLHNEMSKENTPRDGVMAQPYTKAATVVPNAATQPLLRRLQATNPTTTSPLTTSPQSKPDMANADGMGGRVPKNTSSGMSRSSFHSLNPMDALQPWEKEIVQSPEVQRKATLAQMYFLNYYFDSLRYLSDRKERLNQFNEQMKQRGLRPSDDDLTQTMQSLSLGAATRSRPATRSTTNMNIRAAEYERERNKHMAKERDMLRQRRSKLRLQHFHIVTQVGQGGYGEVFLARKRDTGELCALKRLRKRVLVKMDEVRHVLTERDILTATRSPWLVRLLYAFQDETHVYLAMVCIFRLTFRNMYQAVTSAPC